MFIPSPTPGEVTLTSLEDQPPPPPPAAEPEAMDVDQEYHEANEGGARALGLGPGGIPLGGIAGKNYMNPGLFSRTLYGSLKKISKAVQPTKMKAFTILRLRISNRSTNKHLELRQCTFNPQYLSNTYNSDLQLFGNGKIWTIILSPITYDSIAHYLIRQKMKKNNISYLL